MMRVDKLKLIYVDPPKTGSQSMDRLFEHYYGGTQIKFTRRTDKHSKKIPSDCQDYNIAATVRNPYTRAYSLYNMDVNKNISHFGVRLDNFKNYITDVIELCKQKPNSSNLRVYRYYNLTNYLREFNVKLLIKMEDIHTHIKELKLNNAFGNVDNIHANAGTYPENKTWRNVETPELISLINTWAESDFDNYGYIKL